MSVKIRIDGDTQDLEKKLSNIDKTAEKSFTGVKVAAAAVGTALVAVGTYAFTVGKNFEEAMSQVAATMGTTVDEIAELSATAKEMGAATQFSATQAAEALNYLALAGYSAEKSMAVLPQVLNVAAAGGLDLAYASDLVTDSMAALGLSVDELENFTDQLAKTAQTSNTSVGQLGEAILVAGGQARLAGLSVTDMNTALGLLANVGIKGSEGGTALRNTLKNLYTPTTQAADAMAELGIMTTNADGSLVEIQDVLQQFQTQLSGLDEAARLDYMGRIFDTRTLAAANALINQSGAEFDALAAGIENADGAAAAMAETMIDNLGGDITLLQSAMESFGITLYETFSGSARSSVQSLTSSVGQLMKAFQQPAVIKAVDDIGKALGTLLSMVGKAVASVFPALVKVIGQVAAIFNGLQPVISGVFDVVVALATGALNVLAAILGVVADNMAIIVPIAAAITAGILAYNIATGIQTVLTTAQAAASGIAAAAQWAWNAAMAANPIGLLVGGIAALVGGIIALIAWLSADSDKLKELKEDTEAVIAANDELQESIAASAEAYEANVAGIEENAAVSGKLVDRLFETAAAFDGSAASASKMRVLVGQLNDAVPGLNLAFDEQTGALNLTEDAVRALVAAQKEQLLAQARAARASELAAELVKQEESLRALTDQYAEWELALENGEISQRQFNKNTKDLTTEIGEAEAAIGTLNGQIDEYIDASTEASLASEQAAASAAYSEENLQALAEQYGTTVEAIRAATDGTTASLEEWQAAQDDTAQSNAAMVEAMQARYEELAAVSQNVFGRIEQQQAISVSAMIGNLEANTAAMNEWADQLAAIGERTASGELDALQPLIDQLAAGGPEYAAQLAVLNSATDEELAALAEAFATGGDAAMQAMLAEFGLPQNTNMGAETVEEIAAAMAANEALATAATAQINDAVKAMNNAISAANMPGIGRDMVNGIADGIRNNGGGIAGALVAAVQNAIAAAKKEAETASPSKKTRRELGLPMAQGLALGIEDGTPLAVNAATEQTEAVMDAYGDAEMPTMQAEFLAEFADIPVDFFAMGQDAGAEFSEGFLAALGFMSMLENFMLGTPELAFAGADVNGQRYGDVEINFNQPVDSPDTTARAVRDVFEYGLAGERN